MTKIKLKESQIELLLGRFDLDQIKTGMEVLNALNEMEPEDDGSFSQIRKDLEFEGLIPRSTSEESDKDNPFADFKRQLQRESLLPKS